MIRKIRVGIIGVGNCASSLVQGRYYYDDVTTDVEVPGLIHTSIDGLFPNSIEFACGFDVHPDKVNKDLSEAIFAGTNNTADFGVKVPFLDAPVYASFLSDGMGDTYLERVTPVTNGLSSVEEIVAVLRGHEVDVLINYLPVGSEVATRAWAEIALSAGVSFINAIPVFIATDPKWRHRFTEANLVLVGDDIKSQIGATILHRRIVNLCRARGVTIDRTYQLNFGGNMDFKNMLSHGRLESKRKSKTGSVLAELGETDEAQFPGNTHIGPSDFVPWLTDRKWAFIRIEGRAFGGVPYSIETKLEVWDSPNSAGVLMDVIRCVKVAMEREVYGALTVPAAFYMKSPPEQLDDSYAAKEMEWWVGNKVRT